VTVEDNGTTASEPLSPVDAFYEAAARPGSADRGQFLGRRLKGVPVIMDLHELAPVSGRGTSGRRRRLGCESRRAVPLFLPGEYGGSRGAICPTLWGESLQRLERIAPPPPVPQASRKAGRINEEQRFWPRNKVFRFS